VTAANREGRMHEFWSDTVNKYGPYVRIELPGRKLLLITKPEDIQKMFVCTANNPRRDTQSAMLKVRREDKLQIHGNKAGISSE